MLFYAWRIAQTMTKQELRDQIKARIKLMPAEDREAASVQICKEIIGSAEWKKARTVWLYAALPDEVNLEMLFHEALKCSKRILLPVVDGNDLQIRFYDPQHVAVQGKYNIIEPSSQCPQLRDPDGIDLAIIPGRAFTRDGLRMGRGKGYYDRKLASVRCPKWGVAFACQIVEELPADPWDIRLDRVISAGKNQTDNNYSDWLLH